MALGTDVRQYRRQAAYANRVLLAVGARLMGVDLAGADICGADLSTAEDLTEEQLRQTRGDALTKLPDGLQAPKSWAKAPNRKRLDSSRSAGR